MPIQKEVWLPVLKEDYTKESDGDFLSHAQDYSAFVDDAQILHLGEVDVDNAEVYKNRKTDIEPVEPSEKDHAVPLDTYDSQTYKLRSINLHALPYDKISYYTSRGSKKIRERELKEAAFSFAPDAIGSKKVILEATGEDLGAGIRAVTTKDVQKFATALDDANFPEKGRHLVLPSMLYWALVDDNPVLRAQIGYQGEIGKYNPKILELFNIQIHLYNGCPVYNADTKTKEAFGTTLDIPNSIVPAGFLFCEDEAFFAGGKFELFFKDKSQNTSGRAYEVGFQHRFRSGLDRANMKYTGAILSTPIGT